MSDNETDNIWQALREINDRLGVLENANTMPMLLDLSVRLEALENVVVGSWDGQVTFLKDIAEKDAKAQQPETNNWENEGGQ